MVRRGSYPTALKWGLAILVVQGLLAVLGPFIAPYAQDQMMAGLPIQGASLAHPFGTDQMGRDVFSRALAGGWIVIGLSVAGTLLGVLLGSAVGLFSGTMGGWPDEVLAQAGLRVVEREVLDPGVRLDVWR